MPLLKTPKNTYEKQKLNQRKKFVFPSVVIDEDPENVIDSNIPSPIYRRKTLLRMGTTIRDGDSSHRLATESKVWYTDSDVDTEVFFDHFPEDRHDLAV